MAEEKTLLLTQEAYDKMKEELAWREGEYRDEILSKVSTALTRETRCRTRLRTDVRFP